MPENINTIEEYRHLFQKYSNELSTELANDLYRNSDCSSNLLALQERISEAIHNQKMPVQIRETLIFHIGSLEGLCQRARDAVAQVK